MKRKISLIILPFSLLTLAFTCETDNDGKALLLINNSDLDVYFYQSPDLSVGHFPDTILPIERPIGLQQIMANGRSGTFTNPDWNSIYSDLPDGKYSMYVFSKQQVDTTDWEIIAENNFILARIDKTQNELEQSDYTFEFND